MVSDLFFVNLMIKYKGDEAHIYVKTRLNIYKASMKTIFFKDNGKKRYFNQDKQKFVRIPDRNYKVENKFIVTVPTISTYIVLLPDNMWLPLLDQPQLYFVVFYIIYCSVYKQLVTKLKYIISKHGKVTFYESLENLSISIVKLSTVRLNRTAHVAVDILLFHHYMSNLAHLSYLYILVIGIHKSEI